MKLGLASRLFLGFLVVLLLGLGSAGYLVDRTVERAAFDQTADRLHYEVIMTGQMTASALFAPLAGGDASLEGPIHDLADAVHTHLSLIAPSGAVVADSETEIGQTPVQDDSAPEVAQAIAAGRGTSIRGDGTARRLWIAEAVRRDGKLLGVARASIPVSTIRAQVTVIRKQLAFGAGIALLIAALCALFLSIGIVRPIRRLSAAARSLGEGDLNVRANIVRGDEIGALGSAVDEMAGNIQRLVGSLDVRNADMRRVLDTVDQGLVTVDLSGAISLERSARIDTWFDEPAEGATLWSLFPELRPDAALSFEMGWGQLAEDFLPIAVVIDQLPRRLGSKGRTFELRYLPIGDDPIARRILVLMTDVTAQVIAERVETVQRDLLRAIDRTQRDRAGVVEFLRESDVLVSLVTAATTSDIDVKHLLHTLKGNCGVFGMQSVAARCHALESTMAAQERNISDDERKELAASWKELRGGIASLMGGVTSALAVSRSQYVDVLHAALANESTWGTARKLASWVLTPLDVSFARLGEHATSLATRLGKDVDVVCDGDGLLLDNERWGGLWTALVHAVRNAVDHGVEPPDQRAAANKLPSATLKLSAKLEHGSFVVELSDDGRGVAWGAIAKRLVARGLPIATSEQVVEGLFMDGLSTKDDVTEISGRGVGMGALRAAVRERGGRIEVRSQMGAGTTLRCVFPASAALVDPSWVLDRELARQASSSSLESASLPAATAVSLAA
jgi:two-component system chemotaxis sensor kinase CheA